MASRGLCPLEHPALQVHTASPSPEQPSALRRGVGAQDPQGRSPGAQLCSGMVTDSVISPRVSRCYRKAFVPFCKHLCPKTPGGEEYPCETPPPGREETPTEPLGEGGRSQNRGPLGEREAPMQGHPGREEPPHRAPGGGGEETPCGAGGLFAERALEGTKSLQGTGCPKGQSHFPPAEPGQASLLPASSGPRDDKCLLQTCFTWVDRPCPQDHHLT